MSEITQITSKQDQSDRDRLLGALGTENNLSQWLNFMDVVTQLLALVLKQGRTPQKQVEESLIGRLGFTSWRQMIEAPVSENGLGWNWSGWVAWRRAYKVVQDRPYLRDLNLTSNAVVVLDQEAKKDEMEFPSDLETFDHWRANRKENKEKKQAATISELTKQVKALQGELDAIKSSGRWRFLKAFLFGWKDYTGTTHFRR